MTSVAHRSSTARLEDEAVGILREVVAECERPVLLFSGGKDSVVLAHLARRAFFPARIPFPLMHVDTGHNFDEVIEFRDRSVAQLGVELIVASVQASIDAGRVQESTAFGASRNKLQTVTLLDAIAEHRFDAVFGGARRDEERARAKERVVSHRDEFGQWDPKNQRPELWRLYNTRHHRGEHLRVFPLSNWTELDVWRFVAERGIDLPSLYFAHRRQVFLRDGMLMAVHRHVARRATEPPFETVVRFRTIGDATCTAAVESDAATVTRSWPRQPSPGSPNVGRHAPTIASRRPAWRTASARGTSDMAFPGHAMNRPHRNWPLARHRSTAVTVTADRVDTAPAPQHPRRPAPLHVATVGSVDDGKSTLIGRLLHDSKSIFEDQLEHIEAVSRRRGHDYVDLALLTDGLRAEREQGITIDVAHRYFSTPQRDFVIADCPGHVQYTRNMITGVSRADLAVVLVDARHGVVEQTRRHSLLAALLRVPHLVVTVNKIDLVADAEARFADIVAQFTAAAGELDELRHLAVTFIPICARR